MKKQLFERELAMFYTKPYTKKFELGLGTSCWRVCSFRVKRCINCTVDSPVPGS